MEKKQRHIAVQKKIYANEFFSIPLFLSSGHILRMLIGQAKMEGRKRRSGKGNEWYEAKDKKILTNILLDIRRGLDNIG